MAVGLANVREPLCPVFNGLFSHFSCFPTEDGLADAVALLKAIQQPVRSCEVIMPKFHSDVTCILLDELLRQRQTIMAYEKGGIPSDRMVGLNILSIIPASIYLLKNGLPEKPVPPKPHVSNSEIEKMKRSYRESLKKNNNE